MRFQMGTRKDAKICIHFKDQALSLGIYLRNYLPNKQTVTFRFHFKIEIVPYPSNPRARVNHKLFF